MERRKGTSRFTDSLSTPGTFHPPLNGAMRRFFDDLTKKEKRWQQLTMAIYLFQYLDYDTWERSKKNS